VQYGARGREAGQTADAAQGSGRGRLWRGERKAGQRSRTASGDGGRDTALAGAGLQGRDGAGGGGMQGRDGAGGGALAGRLPGGAGAGAGAR
jgi:hypothetical protein